MPIAIHRKTFAVGRKTAKTVKIFPLESFAVYGMCTHVCLSYYVCMCVWVCVYVRTYEWMDVYMYTCMLVKHLATFEICTPHYIMQSLQCL